MQIVCPECKFAREVDENKIPARSQVATCPKCQTKFKFRDLPESEFTIEEPEETATVTQQVPAPGSMTDAEPDPILKPFPMEEAAKPESEAQPTAKAKQSDETEQSAFPDLPNPDADAKGGLWDRLDTMTPPEPPEKEDNTAAQKTGRKPPVIGSRYGQPEEPAESRQPVEGWTGEFNEDFPDPMDYGETEDDPAPDEGSLQVPPPFEQLDRYGFFGGLFTTIKLTLTAPRLFFAVMPVGGGVSKPLTFAILVAMIQALAQLAWGMAGLTIGIDVLPTGVTAAPYDSTTGLFDLLFTPALIAITLYIFSGFYHLILSLLHAETRGFEGTFRALAYSYAPMITGIFPMPTVEILMAWMVVYAIWSLGLTAMAFKHVHKSSYLKVVPALIMPMLLGMILALLVFQGQMPTV